jgi:hypothetical protein
MAMLRNNTLETQVLCMDLFNVPQHRRNRPSHHPPHLLLLLQLPFVSRLHLLLEGC